METALKISELDTQLEVGGIAADPVNLLMLAHTARDLGVSDILVNVMIDEHEPEVARIRAYAKVAVAVARRQMFSGPTADDRVLQVA